MSPIRPTGAAERRAPRRTAASLLIVAVAAGLGGCASLQSSDGFLSRITPYKVEVVQGNVVTREQASLVRPGMTRAQVRDILGSPLITSAFHGDRWDYVFTIRRSGAEPQQRRVLALFEGDRLKSLDTGGELPGEQEFVASIDPTKAPRRTPVLELTDEQIARLPAPRREAAAATTAPAPAPTRTFPPLEPR